MDIKDLAKANEPANSGVWITIKHPVTKEDLPVRFKILGATSDAFYKLRDRLQTEAFTQEKIDHDELGMRLVAGLVVDVEGIEDGKKAVKDALTIFKMDGMRFIFEQLDIEVKKKANFMLPA